MSTLRKLLVTIVVSLFTASLALSLSALYQAGTAAKVSIPPAFPWIVDGFIVAMTLVIVEAKRDGRRLTVWPRLGLYGVTAVSVTVQGVYAPPEAWDKLLHTLAPVAVLWSFESLVWLLFAPTLAAVEPPAAELPDQLPDEQPDEVGRHLAKPAVQEAVQEVVTERRSIEATRTTTRPAAAGTKAERIRELAADGHDLDAIVAETGYPRDTVRVTLRRANSGAKGGEGR
jgi:hypothetical protein